MNTEEILEKSRSENRNGELFEQEVTQKGGYKAAYVATFVAFLLQIIDVVLGKGPNYALFAVAASVFATIFITKAQILKRRHEILVAIVYVCATIFFAAAQIYTYFL